MITGLDTNVPFHPGAAGRDDSIGSRTVKRVNPGRDCTEIVPLCFSVMIE
jgi:hypothetical protein